jgi:hypothetical protein
MRVNTKRIARNGKIAAQLALKGLLLIKNKMI